MALRVLNRQKYRPVRSMRLQAGYIGIGGKRVLGGADTTSVQSILNSAPFYLPLTRSALPQRCANNTQIAFTRATTGTVTNNDGYIVTTLAGEARFSGARRVRNLIPTPENLNGASWTRQAGSVVTQISGSEWEIDITACAANVGVFVQASTAALGGVGLAHVSVKAISGGDSRLKIGEPAGSRYVAQTLTLTSEWQLFNSGVFTITSGAEGIWFQKITGGVNVFRIKETQLEDVTAQTTQTAGPYVSVGALDYRNDIDPLYLSLPGTAGHYASTPDSVAASITGDIDIRVKVALTDWTPAAINALVGKHLGSGDQRSYVFYVNTNGTLGLLWNPDGTALGNIQKASTAATGFTDGSANYVRATLDVDNGAAGNDLKFYTSSDGSQWTQLGSTVTTAGTTSIYDGTASVQLAALEAASWNLNGRIYQAQIFNTIGGTTPVVDFNLHRDATTPTGTFTSSTTGEVWTINGASSVVRNVLYHGAGVDAVRYYDTDILGNPLATSYTYEAVSLNGVAGTYVSTPDSVANSITGDIDIRVKAALADWTPAAETVLAAKWGTGGATNSWVLQVNTDGALRAFLSTTGANTIIKGSVSATGFADGATGWCRCTVDVDNGAAGYDVKFYTSTDGSTWVQLGATVTTATAITLHDPAVTVEIGTRSTGTSSPLNGKIYRAQIYNGIDGTLAVDFDPSRYAGGTTLTGRTGETWTLQGNAKIHATNTPNLGYLAEGARTNLALQSNALTTTWATTGTISVTQNAVGPDGATSAWTLTDNDAAAVSGVFQGISLTSGNTYTASFFVKKTVGVQASYPVVLINNSATGAAQVTIDTSNGLATIWSTITGLTVVTSSALCESVTSTFWRVSVTLACNSTAAWNVVIYPAGTATANKSSGTMNEVALTGSAVVYGAQVELGSFASTYIPTTTAAVTRNADVLTYSSGGNAAVAAGWAYFEYTSTSATLNQQMLEIDDGTTNNRSLDVLGGTSNALRIFGSTGGVTQYDVSTSGVSTAGVTAKAAATYSAVHANASLNSTLGTADTAVTPVASVSQITVGHQLGGSQFYGNQRNLRIGQRALSSLDLQRITL